MPRILLVEDNELNRDMLGRRLRRAGHDVAMAEDAPAGIAAAAREAPDLILMDVGLGGGMDGWQAVERLKAAPRTAGIPVIILTAHAFASDRARAAALGCADFDTKPVDFARLSDKIRAALAPRPAAAGAKVHR
jgi:CheY-like chemotaxis protein